MEESPSSVEQGAG